MINVTIASLRTLTQLLTAGIAITAFSLLLYALSFNLRDRVARSFAAILSCVVVVFVADAIGSASTTALELDFWLRLQFVGLIFLPPAYFHFSDAILATTGRVSRGRRSLAVRLMYLLSLGFLLCLPLGWLVGPLVQDVQPAAHLQRTFLTWVFTGFYAAGILLAGANLVRAYRRTLTGAGRRRMTYLLLGALAPALGSYPYLLFGSGIAERHPLLFWLAALTSNLTVSVLLVLMAYAVAFFGVPWPDRVVKRRLFKWLMRGPVTASTVLAITTVVRRVGESWGTSYTAFVPILMVATILILEHLITLAAPYWERWLFHGGEGSDIDLIQKLEERMVTTGDLRQFLESVLAAVCDRVQAASAFIVVLGPQGMEMVVTVGSSRLLEKEGLSENLLEDAANHDVEEGLYSWGDYWLVPLYQQRDPEQGLLGLLGVPRLPEQVLDEEQGEALSILARRAAVALEDRQTQRQLFTSLEALTPQVEMIQRLRAATRYDSGSHLAEMLTAGEENGEQSQIVHWVREALTHYWGGPKLTQSPLLGLRVVRRALAEHEGNPTNALRAVLRQAIEQVRPEGERRFTGEWILYNILEMKFIEGRKVREVALRLAMSEADLYRKQRVAIESVAETIEEMEQNLTNTQEPASQV